ncbi:hypothetical protein FJTKL_13858 [Diaporthe vaccinii]|uniref:Carbonic anhydrase n=1 Tax=Diaporthe vaccinii TaxID=105482 RepID=A0ABR4F941_9PEZI
MATSSLTVNTANRQAMLAANSQYVASRPAQIGQLQLTPTKHYLIVTCIDARIDPAAAFGINPGEAHVIRNAGGSAVAALRDIIISTHFLDVKEVFIIKHKNCGMTLLNSMPKPISQLLYPDKIVCPGAASIVDMPWYDFECPYSAVRQDWFFVQNHPAIRAEDPTNPDRKIIIHGFVYDPATGKLDDVSPRVPPSQNPIPGSQPNGPDPAEGGGGGGGGCGGGSTSCEPANPTVYRASLSTDYAREYRRFWGNQEVRYLNAANTRQDSSGLGPAQAKGVKGLLMVTPV